MSYARTLVVAIAIAVPLGAQDATTAAVVRELDTYVPKALAEWNGAGIAVGIVKDDQLVYAKGFGVREAGKLDPVDDKTLFAVGSNTEVLHRGRRSDARGRREALARRSRSRSIIPGFTLYDPWVTREFTLRDDVAPQRPRTPR